MSAKKIAYQTIAEKNGAAKAADLISAGLTRQDINKLYKEGYMERICQGYYQLSAKAEFPEEQLIAAIIPKGIVSVESALYHYGYHDFAPRKWSVTVPRTISRKILNTGVIPLQIYYVKEGIYDLGKTTDIFNGVLLNVYDRERTICDCFKYRTKLDHEIFNKAVNTYVNDHNKNLKNLSIYAKELHVYNKVMELMEVLLND